jgi:hypothetical protein
MTGSMTGNPCSSATWAAANGYAYDYAIYVRGDAPVTGGENGVYRSSCWDIKSNGESIGSGVYWIETGSAGPYQVYCDMQRDGGGLTMVLNLDTSDGHVMVSGG